ncbi:TIGR00725 family protein [candidate division KSB1 bacterium]
MERKKIIGLIGGGECTPEIEEAARNVGRGIAEKGGILICGGLGGVMEAGAKGAKEAGGTTIGVIPGMNPNDANKYIDIPIASGVGYARNIIIVNSSDSVIAVSGKFGTLSEIAFCLQFNVPVISLFSWKVHPSIIIVDKPEKAVELAFSLRRKIK